MTADTGPAGRDRWEHRAAQRHHCIAGEGACRRDENWQVVLRLLALGLLAEMAEITAQQYAAMLAPRGTLCQLRGFAATYTGRSSSSAVHLHVLCKTLPPSHAGMVTSWAFICCPLHTRLPALGWFLARRLRIRRRFAVRDVASQCDQRGLCSMMPDTAI